jgi:hypothetical protein
MLLYFSVTLKNFFQNYCSFIHFDDATFQNSAYAFCSMLLLILKYSDQTIDSDAYFSFVELNLRITCDRRRQSRIMRRWRDIDSYSGSTRVLNVTKTFCNLLGFHSLSFVLILDFISDSRQPCQSLPVLFQSLMRFKFCA